MGASKKSSSSKSASRSADSSLSKPALRGAETPLEYYLGAFTFDEYSDRDHEGNFQIIVQARSPEDAGERCRTLLEKLRLRTTLFHRPCTIFLDGLLRLRGSFEEGLLVNYTSSVSELSAQPRVSISCLVPEQEHASESYDWSPEPKGKKRKKQEEEESTLEPFIDFGGQSLCEERAAKQKDQTAPLPHPFDPAADREKAAKKEANAAKIAKKAAEERQKVLASTMRELQVAEGPRRRSRP